MSERRPGTVTFLFTDVEGSTRLLKQLREGYGAQLADHQRLIREAFARHHAEEVDTQGDAFFYVFSRARDAAAAAADAQRALKDHPWPEDVEFRVRMGMHTGEPNMTDDGRYHGLGVHRAARIMAAAHGGQVLASQATASVLADDELDGVTLRDLGEHNLKDLDRPERIYQLDIEGLPHQFPPLRTDAPAAAAEELAAAPQPLYRRPLVIGTVAGVVAAAVAIPIFAFGGGSGGGGAVEALAANSVGFVDAESGRIAADIGDVPTPARVAAGAGAIWVTSPDSGTVSRIDPRSDAVRQTIPTGSGASGIAVGAGSVWAANTLDGTVSRVDVATNQVVQSIKVGNSPTAVAYGAGSVWVTNLDDGTLSQIDAKTGSVVATRRIGAAGRGVAFGAGAVWVTDSARNRVVRLDPQRGTVVRTINVGSGPTGIAYGDRMMWVANNLDGTLSAIDPTTNAVRATVAVGVSPNAIAFTRNAVWVADEADRKLVRLDAQRATVTSRVELGSRPGGIAAAGDGIWTSAQGAATEHRGGTLRMRAQQPPESIDPGIAYSPVSWPIVSITNDGLVTFKRVGGGDGTQLVADLATSVPTPTDDGKTYTFQLRRGIRFSNGKAVTPADVRHSIEREFSFADSPGPGFFANIVGAGACAGRPTPCDLSRGIVVDEKQRTVTFHLRQADPEFLYKLALPTGAVVPANAPLRESKVPLPATGPYMIQTRDAMHGLRLVRNPYFRVWSAAAKPAAYANEITLTVDPNVQREVTAVERGRIDVAFSGQESALPPNRLRELTTQYARLVHITPQAATVSLQLNTREPPFDDRRVRRAVAYAVDRGAIALAVGGTAGAQPTCTILPPNFPGYVPYCPYVPGAVQGLSWGPDLRRARTLVRASGTTGARVTLWLCSCLPTAPATGILRRAFEQLGYRVRIRNGHDIGAYFDAINDTARSRAQVAIIPWAADYPAPSNFFDLLTCARTTSINSSKGSRFCDRAIDGQIDQAKRLQQVDSDKALSLWRRVHRELIDAAPWIPLLTPRGVNVTSARTQNFQRHPVFGILLDQLWVK